MVGNIFQNIKSGLEQAETWEPAQIARLVKGVLKDSMSVLAATSGATETVVETKSSEGDGTAIPPPPPGNPPSV
jgi:hypothetical protein